MLRPQPQAWLLVPVVVALAGFSSRPASAQDFRDIDQQLTEIERRAERLTRGAIGAEQARSPLHVEERLAEGEIFYRLQDYLRASIIFTDIVDSYPNHRAYPDALFLLGDALYRAGDHLGGRSRFRQIIERADQPAFRPYVQRALGRLIEISVQTRDFDGVESYFARLSQLPPSEIEAATAYHRAKYLYSRAVPPDDVARGGNAQIDQALLEQARVAFEGVQEGSPYFGQSRYFIGVIHTLRGQYPQGVEAFRRVLRARTESVEERAVVELAQLALGRLYYETDQLDQAAQAYQAIPRSSTNFDVALYELAWVYIRLGDSLRAERSLEVLAIAAPDSRYIPDAKILRGNLLLRNGRFIDASTVFREIGQQFGPVRRELDQVIADHSDTASYFREIVRNNIESFDANAFLPAAAVPWSRSEGDMERALSVLSDLSQCRQLLRETQELVQRLDGALRGANRIALYPDLRRERETSVMLRNRLAGLRRDLAGDAEGGSGELAEVRARRREIERLLGGMPTSEEEFASRDSRVLNHYRGLERELRRLEIEVLGLEARIVATEQFIDRSRDRQRDPNAMEGVRAELGTHRNSVAEYRRQIDELRVQVEGARLQVGVGDSRYLREDRLRSEYTALIARERQLGGRADPRSDALFGRIAAVEARLDARDAEVDRVVAQRVAAMQQEIARETTNLEGYRAQVATLEADSETIVGAVALANFNQVRQRFYDLVLRADVGRVDVAWSQREEHRSRVEMLTRERAREMQILDDEFREIMDESSQSEREQETDDAEDEGAQ